MLSAIAPLSVFAQATDPPSQPVDPIPGDGDTDRTFFFMDQETTLAVGIIGGIVLLVVVIVALVSMASHGGGHTHTHA